MSLHPATATSESPSYSSANLLRSLTASGVLQGDDAAELVKAYQRGLTAGKKLRRARDLSAKQEAKLRRDTAEGEQAAERLIGSMVRLSMRIVREIAESRYGREGAAGMIDELMTEANISVLEAASKFDAAKGPAFNTWAAQQVRNKVRSMVMDDNTSGIKLASSWSRMRRRAVLERQDMSEELGREPTLTELHDRLYDVCMDWAYDHLTPAQQSAPPEEREQIAIGKLRKQGMLSALKYLDEVLVSGTNPTRLDTPLGDSEDGATIGTLLPDYESGTEAHDRASAHELRETLMAALSKLTYRERAIVLYRFGFDGDRVWTYQEIGEVFSVSAERIRQIEERVRAQMREDPQLSDVLWAHLHPEAA